MGLVKTRRLAAMQKQQRAKAGMIPPMKRNMQKRMRFDAHGGARACCKDAGHV